NTRYVAESPRPQETKILIGDFLGAAEPATRLGLRPDALDVDPVLDHTDPSRATSMTLNMAPEVLADDCERGTTSIGMRHEPFQHPDQPGVADQPEAGL